MDNNEYILEERIAKTQQVIGEYGIDNFYMAWSGGKDSCVMSKLIDLALPGNNIPRVYCDTGIELNIMRSFVQECSESDKRIQIIKPSVNIRTMLEQEGYPFKSKEHSHYLNIYQKNGITKTYYRYLQTEHNRRSFECPKILRYQFTTEFNLKVSDKCCKRLKKDPSKKWSKENNKPYAIVGIMRSEGGADRMPAALHFTTTNFKPFNHSLL